MSIDPLAAGILMALAYSHIIAFALGRLTARADAIKIDAPHKDGGS
jgi:hypothetical protein